MILGAVHKSAGIHLSTEENPGKPQLVEKLTLDWLDHCSHPSTDNGREVNCRLVGPGPQ